MDLMVRERVLASVSPLLYRALLIALRKKDGGIRPIAIGCTLRRLCCKIISTRIQEETGTKLRPVQLSYGTRGSAETGVHATRRFFDSNSDRVKAMLKIDFKIAFNMIHRQRVMQATYEFMPDYAPFFWSCYGQPSKPVFGRDTILSQRGVQQADPLGPALFVLTTHALAQ